MLIMKSTNANIQHLVIISKETGYNVSNAKRFCKEVRYSVSNTKTFAGKSETVFPMPKHLRES